MPSRYIKTAVEVEERSSIHSSDEEAPRTAKSFRTLETADDVRFAELTLVFVFFNFVIFFRSVLQSLPLSTFWGWLHATS